MRYLFGILIVGCLLLSFKATTKKVLVIGDSISIGYTPHIRTNLSGMAEVSHNPGNAQHTGTGLKKIDQWLGSEQYDLICFNWGLWDLRLQGSKESAEKRKNFYTVEEYAKNLEQLVLRLKKTGSKLLFVTTSVVPAGGSNRAQGDELKYNKAAKAIMKKYNIKVCDLHKASVKIHKKYGKPNGDVHYTPDGYKALGDFVTKYVKRAVD